MPHLCRACRRCGLKIEKPTSARRDLASSNCRILRLRLRPFSYDLISVRKYVRSSRNKPVADFTVALAKRQAGISVYEMIRFISNGMLNLLTQLISTLTADVMVVLAEMTSRPPVDVVGLCERNSAICCSRTIKIAL